MLRVAKPTSPMTLVPGFATAYGPGSALAAAPELLPLRLRGTVPGRLLHVLARPAGLGGGGHRAGSRPTRRSRRPRRPRPPGMRPAWVLLFVYTGSAAASGGGLGMLVLRAGRRGGPGSPAWGWPVAGAAVVVGSTAIELHPSLPAKAYTTGSTACAGGRNG